MENKTMKQNAEKIYGWLLECLQEYCEENADDHDDFERLYEMVWQKFQNKK